MLETLLALLAYDLPAPEIYLVAEDSAKLNLEWNFIWITINPAGGVAWAMQEPREHGSDLDRLKGILKEREAR